jgi:hypothetical protein
MSQRNPEDLHTVDEHSPLLGARCSGCGLLFQRGEQAVMVVRRPSDRAEAHWEALACHVQCVSAPP